MIGLGEALSIGSAATWAVGVILYRKLGESVPPLTLNFLKNALVLLMVGALLAVVHGKSLAWPDAGPLALAMASGLLGIAVADTLYLKALNTLGAGRMGVVGNLYSPLVLLLGFVFLDERLRWLQWCGFALVLVGVLLIAWPARRSAPTRGEIEVLNAEVGVDVASGSALGLPGSVASPAGAPPLRGFGLAALSIALMAVAIVMVKPVLESEALLQVTAIRLAGALLGLVLLAALRGELGRLSPPAGLDWRSLVLAAFVGQLLSMLFWLGGYKYAPASVAAVLNETASVFILLLAWLWLGERPGRRSLAGVLLSMAGVGFMLAG